MLFRVGHFIPSVPVTAVFLHSWEGQVYILEEQAAAVARPLEPGSARKGGSLTSRLLGPW